MSEHGKQESTATSAGQVLVILGLVLVYGAGGYWFAMEVVRDENAPIWLQIGTLAIIIGVLVLLLSVIFQRMKAAKTDKYIDVED
jgi:hypothetical protein